MMFSKTNRPMSSVYDLLADFACFWMYMIQIL